MSDTKRIYIKIIGLNEDATSLLVRTRDMPEGESLTLTTEEMTAYQKRIFDRLRNKVVNSIPSIDAPNTVISEEEEQVEEFCKTFLEDESVTN